MNKDKKEAFGLRKIDKCFLDILEGLTLLTAGQRIILMMELSKLRKR